MSSSPAMTKHLIHIALLILSMVIPVSVQAQFVSIRLELPAGIHFNAQMLDPMEGGTWENSKAKIWVGIESQENLTLLLDLEYPEGEILPAPEAYFLNDGTNDFEKALKLIQGSHELLMNSTALLIQNLDPRPTHIQAWLGLPVLNGITIKLEYP
ncbi:hypothetical protein [Algoriphagus lacus]|nr:hypothetical protein [Algoriphagus lacus]